MKLRFEVLPAPQKEFWDGLVGAVPAQFVLYGGTAVALRLGHRSSIDFDFFSDWSFEYDQLLEAMPALRRSTVLDRRPNTLTVAMPMSSGEVKLSFFGGVLCCRIGDPDLISDKVPLASLLDLFATELKALHDRIEPKDYLDIEALLKSDLTLNQGIAAARSLYGEALNPLDTAKAVGWFKDGGLDRKLSGETRAFLHAASISIDPRIEPLPIRSTSLSPR